MVPFLPEKGPHGNRNVQRDEKAAAAETAGREGAPRGGSWGQLEPEWARQERAPGKAGILEETRKGRRGPRPRRWHGEPEQSVWEDVGSDGTGDGWSSVGRRSEERWPGLEAMRGGEVHGGWMVLGGGALTEREGQHRTAW